MKPSLFDLYRRYLLAQTAVTSRQEKERPPFHAVTISRETGAGAITIGRLLVEYLESMKGADARYPWAIFDRELVKKILEDHSLPEALEKYMPEDAKSRVQNVFEDLLGVHPSSWTLLQHTNHTILRLALNGNVVLVGRGSYLVTASLRHVFHVRLIAPLEFRIRHIEEYYHLDRNDAAEFIRKEDHARSRYIRKNFTSHSQTALQFHVTINTALTGFHGAARLIGDATLNMPGR